MNVIILGAGAVGCYMAGRLASAGERVTLVGRPRTTEPLALSGLTVTDLQGFKAYVEADLSSPTLSIASDLKMVYASKASESNDANETTVVLLCVKGGATTAAAQEIADCCPAGTVIVSLQNGVDNVARISKVVPQMTALAGMVPYNVVMRSATHVHRATMGQIYIEKSEVTTDITTKLVAKFNAAGLKAAASDQMRSVQWGKLLLNVNNPINALSDLPLREQLLNRDFRYVSRHEKSGYRTQAACRREATHHADVAQAAELAVHPRCQENAAHGCQRQIIHVGRRAAWPHDGGGRFMRRSGAPGAAGRNASPLQRDDVPSDVHTHQRPPIHGAGTAQSVKNLSCRCQKRIRLSTQLPCINFGVWFVRLLGILLLQRVQILPSTNHHTSGIKQNIERGFSTSGYY